MYVCMYVGMYVCMHVCTLDVVDDDNDDIDDNDDYNYSDDDDNTLSLFSQATGTETPFSWSTYVHMSQKG